MKLFSGWILLEILSKALDTHSAWVTEYIEETRQLRALAFWADGQLLADFKIVNLFSREP